MRIIFCNRKAIDPGRIIYSIVIFYAQCGNNTTTEFVFVGLVIGWIIQKNLVASLVRRTAKDEGFVALCNQRLGGF